MKKNIAQTLIGIVLGGVFLFLTLKNKPMDEIITSIRSANLFWVLMSGLSLIAVFFLRAMRWRVLVENIGYQPKKRHIIYALVMGYFVNSFTPKVGEIMRCTSLKNKSDVPVANSLGTVVSERVYDIIILGVGLVIIFFLEINRLGHILSGMTESVKGLFTANAALSAGIAIVVALGAYMVFRFMQKKGMFNRITGFVSDLFKTVRATFRIKKYNSFILYTLLIWVALIVMNYCFLKSLPETESHGLYFATVVLFVGSIGWAMPSPGGIGTTHFFILQLFLAFSLSESAGIAFGVLSNGLTFVFTIVFGLIAVIYNSISKI